jgi:DNA-binding MarR family transcriptional regulator
VDLTAPERLHEMLMDLVRAAGLLQPDRAVPGQPVSMSQAFALHELDTDDPLSQRDLAERLCLEKSTVSRMAAEMERKGLLVRERDPANRRLYRLRLTDRGRALHGRMASVFHEQYVRWVSAMTRAERDALLAGLPALVRAIRGEPAVSGPAVGGPAVGGPAVGGRAPAGGRRPGRRTGKRAGAGLDPPGDR